ncbi:methyltransferase domain-containing protein, partial [Entophlyctis helioformis]
MMNVMPKPMRLPDGFNDPAQYAAALAEWLKEALPLCSIHVLDLALHRGLAFWTSHMPQEWSRWIEQQQQSSQSHEQLLQECASVALGQECPVGWLHHWPPSLQRFVQKGRRMRLPRNVDASDFGSIFANGIPSDYSTARTTKAGMSRKKLQEVERLAAVVLALAREQRVDVIVDVGAGTGYLSHVLSESFPVLAIDSDDARTCASQARGATGHARSSQAVQDEQAQTQRRKQRKPASNAQSDGATEMHGPQRCPVEYLTRRLDATALTDAIRARATHADIVANGSVPRGEKRFMLVGLHACGDLSAQVIPDTFMQSPFVVGMVSVGCCYHLLTEQGFPRSKTIRESGLMLSKSHLKQACQTYSKFEPSRLRDLWRTQSYRAQMEVLVRQHFPDRLSLSTDQPDRVDGEADECGAGEQGRVLVGPLPKTAYGHGFKTYASAMCAKLGGEPARIAAEADGSLFSSMVANVEAQFRDKHLEHRIALLSVLRSAICIESVVVVDRLLSLLESGQTDACALNLFDVTESSRNMAIYCPAGH